MTTANLKGQIDQLWEQFWTSDITNPLTVIEQISYLIFARLLDVTESRNERRWGRKHPGEEFPGELFPPEKQHLRWSRLRQIGDADKKLRLVREELFPLLRDLAANQTSFGAYLKGASCLIEKPSLLNDAIEKIDKLPLTGGDDKGDLYEYMLSKLSTAGINGQFRTPRHIIQHMLAMVDPAPDSLIADPACGTAGFLVGTMEYLMRRHTSDNAWIEEPGDNGEVLRIPTGDKLEPWRDHIRNAMFTGFDFDVTMLRIACMNLMLHDVPNPRIEYQDTLSRSFSEQHPQLAEDRFDLVLANPPFKGSIDDASTDPALTGVVKTKKTELLFLVRILRMLKMGGRCAAIVPDGVLFGSSRAHQSARKMLIRNNQLDAIVSLPSGVFKPYAGVKTAILFFTKGGQTRDVFFYDLEHDGFTLDDKRTPDDKNDLPDCLDQWEQWTTGDRDTFTDRTRNAFAVTATEIAENDYDLSINRYKEVVYEAVEYDPPKVILKRLAELEEEIAKGREELEGLLG